MSKFLKKGRTDCWPWQESPDTAPNRDSTMACNDSMCCNPGHVIEDKSEAKEALVAVETIVSLREACEKLGVHYDKRWGLDKLKAALTAAKE